MYSSQNKKYPQTEGFSLKNSILLIVEKIMSYFAFF